MCRITEKHIFRKCANKEAVQLHIHGNRANDHAFGFATE